MRKIVLKRECLNFDELAEKMEVVRREEQRAYLGGYGYMVYNDGTISYISDEGGSNYHTFYTPNGVFNFNGSINIGATSGGTVIHGDNMKPLFEFLAQHTSVEWNLQQNSNTGSGQLTTSHLTNTVCSTQSGIYDENYHNHASTYKLSTEDSAYARGHSGVDFYIYNESENRYIYYFIP